MSTVLFLRGEPGAGKKTVADTLAADLGWPLVWLHSYDEIFRTLGYVPGPELMDTILQPVAERLMADGRDFLFVRPARSAASVRGVHLAAVARGCRFVVVRLTADRDTLARRVTERPASPFRVSTERDLDYQLLSRATEPYPGEHEICTTNETPEYVAWQVKRLLT